HAHTADPEISHQADIGRHFKYVRARVVLTNGTSDIDKVEGGIFFNQQVHFHTDFIRATGVFHQQITTRLQVHITQRRTVQHIITDTDVVKVNIAIGNFR